MTLTGRTCVFSGATGAIGEGAVRAMAEAGMNVVMVTHNPDRAADIVESCKGLPGTVTARSNKIPFSELLTQVESEFGSVDMYVNKTGVLSAPCSMTEVEEDFLTEKLHHQITSAFTAIQTVLPFLKRSKAGRILLCVNGGALDGDTKENPADSIARGAVISMVKVLAREFSPDRITVNAVALSGMVPDHLPKPGKDLEYAKEEIPLGHIGTTEEFGALVSYVASEESGFTTGHIFNMTGGRVIG